MYFAHPIDFFALPISKKKYEFIRYNGFSLVWDLVLIFIRAILEQSINNNGEQNLSCNVYYRYVLTLLPNL